MNRIVSLSLLFLLCFVYCSNSWAEQSKIDSLKKLFGKAKEDTNKVNILNSIARQLVFKGKYDSAIQCANQARIISEKLSVVQQTLKRNYLKKQSESLNMIGVANARKGNDLEALNSHFYALKLSEGIDDKQGVSGSFNHIGNIYYNQGNYNDALLNHNSALKIRQEIGDKKGIGGSLVNIGNVYIERGDYPAALKHYYDAIKILEEINNTDFLANALDAVSNIFQKQSDYSTALEYKFKSLRIREKNDDNYNSAITYHNIGIIYRSQGDNRKALEYALKAFNKFEKMGNKVGVGASYTEIGNIYLDENNFSKCLEYYNKALEIENEVENTPGIVIAFENLGYAYFGQTKFNEARKYFSKGLFLAKEMGSKEAIKEIYFGLSQVDSAEGNYKSTYEHYKQYIIYRDSLFNEENTRKTVQNQMQYEFDKKEVIEKKEQEKKDAIQIEELKRQRTQRNAILGGLILVLILAGFIFRSYRQKQRANEVISAQKLEVERQKGLVDEKNHEILDSINYAKRIQRSMLPHRSDILKTFSQSFVLFKPKDIVSGDFYWFQAFLDSTKKGGLIAAADCTGHGVPGAFMSTIGIEKLNDSIKQSQHPGQILQLVNRSIKAALRQDEGSNIIEKASRDGMDIALVSLEYTDSGAILQYAGANRPLWVIPISGELQEQKATKRAMGGTTEDDQIFETHTFHLNIGDTFYLFSDGYADQFSKQNKKLMTKRFKDILTQIQSKSLPEQKIT